MEEPGGGTVAQTEESVAKNKGFFGARHDAYSRSVSTMDTYARIRESIDEALAGVDRLLDVGNGGVFDYDTSIVRQITALDLIFTGDGVHPALPVNAQPRAGSVLAIPADDGSYDGVLMSMLLHHLVGTTVSQSCANVERALQEVLRVLRPGGRLVVIESCVPNWFYAFERLLFPVAVRVINTLLPHPATLQYPPQMLRAMLGRLSLVGVDVSRVPKGRWVIQYGFKFPSVLTPVQVYRFIVEKEARERTTSPAELSETTDSDSSRATVFPARLQVR